MTTKPLRVLKAQADSIAATLKAAERNAARKRERFKVGLVMDDKVITIEMSWATINTTSEVGLAEYILNQMREARDPVN